MLELLSCNAELLVLARYMQILSGGFLERVACLRSTSTIRSCRRSQEPIHTAERASAGLS
jgi:hypothetical protein